MADAPRDDAERLAKEIVDEAFDACGLRHVCLESRLRRIFRDVAERDATIRAQAEQIAALKAENERLRSGYDAAQHELRLAGQRYANLLTQRHFDMDDEKELEPTVSIRAFVDAESIDVQVDFRRDPARWFTVRNALVAVKEKIERELSHQHLCPARPRTLASPQPDAGAQERAALGWQLIETAPRDGRWILIGYFEFPGQDSMQVAFWKTKSWCTAYADLTADPNWQPTHWMPLPPPPAGENRVRALIPTPAPEAKP